jgi:His/Glu/Gln/Arg/opine family amino acid ABC transporter permease subunit
MDSLSEHFFNIEAFWRARIILLDGAIGTIKLATVSLALALGLGIVVFAVQLSPWRPAQIVAEWFIDVMRAFPILVFLVLTYYLFLPLLAVRGDPFLAAAVAFAMKHGAYFAEVYRSAWLAVERGQLMAAASLGLRPWRTAQLVVVPQAALVILPPLTNQIAFLIRDMPFAFVIGYFELLTSARAAEVLVRNSTPLVAAILAYVFTLTLLQWLIGRLEIFSQRRLEA